MESSMEIMIIKTRREAAMDEKTIVPPPKSRSALKKIIEKNKNTNEAKAS